MSDRPVPIVKLVLWPGVITLGVTLLRVVGERLAWSPALFSSQAGGGGALIGISWLPPVFGVLFGIQLARAGHAPRSGGRAVGMALAGVAVVVGIMVAAGKLGLVAAGSFSVTGLVVFTVAVAIGAALAWSGWPALGRTLFAYALAARVPVALLMLVAMLGDWKTHYDAPPPGFPADMGVLSKWLLIGAFPQLTVWLAVTVLFGAVFGSIAGALASRGRAAGA